MSAEALAAEHGRFGVDFREAVARPLGFRGVDWRAAEVGPGGDAAEETSLLLLAGAGSFSLTGSTAGVFYGRKIAAGAGSYLLTGTAATFVSHVWHDSFVSTLNANSGGGLNGTNAHIVIGAAALSTSGSKIRITLKGSTAGEGSKTSACYIQQPSGAGPTQVTMDGGTTSLEVAAGATKLTDEITFAVDETKDLYISWFFNDASKDGARQNFSSPNANCQVFFKTAADDSANPTNTSGYSSSNPFEFIIDKVEVFS